MPEELIAAQAASRVRTRDTMAFPLGPGQPPALLRVLGERDDREVLRVGTALLAVGTQLFSFRLYALALGAPRTIADATPIGGVALLAGWLGLSAQAA